MCISMSNLYELFMFSIIYVGLKASTCLIITKAPHMDTAVKQLYGHNLMENWE